MRRIDIDQIKQQIHVLLVSWGMTQERAQHTAEIMSDADLAGIDSHGISMIPGYFHLVESGELAVAATPEIIAETAATVVLDGGHALGHVTTAEAMKIAIDRTSESGLAAVAVRRSRHFGAAGFYAAMAAEAGLIGMVLSTTRTRAVTPTRGTRPLLGTNPLAFASPSSGDPFVLDMSTSTVAVNKLKVYEYEHRPLPDGWVVDGQGNDVTDSNWAYCAVRGEEDGGLTPLGRTESQSSHKGYGLGVMVQILAGALTGTAFGRSRSDAEDDGVGHFCLAISPEFFGDQRLFESSVSQILDTLRSEPSLNPDQPVLVAGDKERSLRAARRSEGVPLSQKLCVQIAEVCEKSGTQFLLT